MGERMGIGQSSRRLLRGGAQASHIAPPLSSGMDVSIHDIHGKRKMRISISPGYGGLDGPDASSGGSGRYLVEALLSR